MTTETDRTKIQRENRARLVAYFAEGIAEAGGPQRIGVEVEHFIVQDNQDKPVYYHAHDGVIGVEDILDHMLEFYPQKILNSHGDLLGLANETGSVTLEPAAQLELSIAPYTQVADIETAYCAFRAHLDPYLAKRGCHIASYGYHPSSHALDLPLIPKERYGFMNAHFARIGTHGERMMRASASTQMSIDYYSEADAVRKLRIATALGPAFAHICDNTPVFEGEPSNTPLDRLNLWRDVDNERCGTIPGVFDEGFDFGAYADWLLRTPPIFVTRPAADNPDGPALRGFSTLPASEVYADAPMARRDIEHLISMFWPDVRLKRFVEIRQADCLPPACVYGYAALIKGLFYSEENLATLENMLGASSGIWPLDDASVNDAIAAIRAQGAKAQVYGTSLVTWVDALFALAARALSDSETKYLESLRAWMRSKWNRTTVNRNSLAASVVVQ